jgi:hypothetical protein
VHLDARQVTEHHAAVVGRGEIRVGGGELVGPGDHVQPEALRGLAPPQRFPAWHRAHHAVVGDHDGVGGRHGHAGRLMDAQRRDAVGDDPLVHQRARGVVQQHAAAGGLVGEVRGPGGRSLGHAGPARDGGQGRARGVRPGHPALDDRRDLAVPAVGQHGPDLLGVAARHDHDDLVHAWRLLEGGHAVLDQRPAAQREQLLRQRPADPLARAAAEYHRDHPHDRDSIRPHAVRRAAIVGQGVKPGHARRRPAPAPAP